MCCLQISSRFNLSTAISPSTATSSGTPNPSTESVARLLNSLLEPQSLNDRLTKQLSYLLKLLPPDQFTPIDKLYEQLFSALKVLREQVLLNAPNSLPLLPPEALVAVDVLALFQALDLQPAAEESARRPDRKLLTRQLIDAVLDLERLLILQPASSPFRKPLVTFVAKWPRVALDLLLSDEALIDQTYVYFVLSLIKSQHAELKQALCSALSADAALLARVERLVRGTLPESGIGATEMAPESLRYVGVRLLELLVRHDAQWISDQHELVALLRATLTRSDYLPQFRQLHALDWEFWNEPKLVLRVLLEYYRRHTDDVDLLFDLLPSLTAQLPLNLAFFSKFLEETVLGFSIEQKRRAFFRFMQLFTDAAVSAERKANVLQYVIIPAFAHEFERGAQDALIGTSPSPEALDSPDDVVGVLLASFFFDSQSESAQSQSAAAAATAAAHSGAGEASQAAAAPSTVSQLTPSPPTQPVLNDRCKILIYQFLILIVQHAPAHIHDSSKCASRVCSRLFVEAA